jgi:ABC-2 type transport system permease protein
MPRDYLRLSCPVALSAAYASIGILQAAYIKPDSGFLVSIVIGLFFHIIFQIVASGMKGFFGQVINWLSTTVHFESLSRVSLTQKTLYTSRNIFHGFIPY